MDSSVVLFVITVLCREEALKVDDIKPKLDELGVKPVVLFHEWIQREVRAALVERRHVQRLRDPTDKGSRTARC